MPGSKGLGHRALGSGSRSPGPNPAGVASSDCSSGSAEAHADSILGTSAGPGSTSKGGMQQHSSRLGLIRTTAATPHASFASTAVLNPAAAAAAAATTAATMVSGTPVAAGGCLTSLYGALKGSEVLDGSQSPMTPISTPFSYTLVDPFDEDPSDPDRSDPQEGQRESLFRSKAHGNGSTRPGSAHSTGSQHSLQTSLKNPLFASGTHFNPLFSEDMARSVTPPPCSHGSSSSAPQPSPPAFPPTVVTTVPNGMLAAAARATSRAAAQQATSARNSPRHSLGPTHKTRFSTASCMEGVPVPPGRLPGSCTATTGSTLLLGAPSLAHAHVQLGELAMGIAAVREQNRETRERLERLERVLLGEDQLDPCNTENGQRSTSGYRTPNTQSPMLSLDQAHAALMQSVATAAQGVAAAARGVLERSSEGRSQPTIIDSNTATDRVPPLCSGSSTAAPSQRGHRSPSLPARKPHVQQLRSSNNAGVRSPSHFSAAGAGLATGACSMAAHIGSRVNSPGVLSRTASAPALRMAGSAHAASVVSGCAAVVSDGLYLQRMALLLTATVQGAAVGVVVGSSMCMTVAVGAALGVSMAMGRL